MNILKCEFCGHYNPAGAETCEECESPAGGTAAAARGAGETPPDYFATRGDRPGAGAPTPDIPAPPFRGAADVISPTLGIYRKHFVLVGLLVAVTTLPVALLQYAALEALLNGGRDVTEASRAISFAQKANVIAVFLSFLGTALLSGALVHAVIEIQRTGAASAGESLRRGLAWLPKVFVVTILYTLVTIVGYVLLIVPGIIFSVMYSMAVPVAVVERLGPFASMARSARLTGGYRWLVFITHFLWGVVVGLLTLLVGGSFVAAGNANALAPLLVQSVVVGMLTSSATVLTVYIYLGILNDRRADSEGDNPAPVGRLEPEGALS